MPEAIHFFFLILIFKRCEKKMNYVFGFLNQLLSFKNIFAIFRYNDIERIRLILTKMYSTNI